MTGSKSWGWDVAVPELGVGIGGDGVCAVCAVVLGEGVVGCDVEGPAKRES